MAATHKSALTMGDGHSCSHRTEGLLPRAIIYAHSALGMGGVKCGQVTSAPGYLIFYMPGQSGTAPASALLLAWTLWCSPAFLTPRLSAFSLYFSLCVTRQSWLARALHLQLLSSWLICLSLQSLCSFTMARKRGRPRRGAAWDAHKAQRRRKEQLERALALATSILRKKARAEKLALLATIAEPGAGCSRDVKANTPGDRQEAGTEEEFPPCIVVEDPFMEDLSIAEKTRATEATHREERRPILAQEDDTPGCIVEEIPWPGDDNFSSHDIQVNEAETKGAEVDAEQRVFDAGFGVAVDSRNVPLSDVGGSMHGSLLREEHLALVFDLRGHLSDLEHRALIMGQRMDMLLDAFSNAPAQRKCPLCAQAFAIPAGSTWQTGEDDRSPGT
jgi:hypothetical protein